MASFILHTRASELEQGRLIENYFTPASVARWCPPPKNLVDSGQIPKWARTMVVSPDGVATPVIEEMDQVAHLHAMSLQAMWHSFRIGDDGQVWMTRYDTEARGVEVSPQEMRTMGHANI